MLTDQKKKTDAMIEGYVKLLKTVAVILQAVVDADT